METDGWRLGGGMKRVLIVSGSLVALSVGLVLTRGIPSDTEQDIFRDPARGTVFRMSQLENAVRTAWRDSGGPPQSMAALLAAVPNASRYRADRWSNPIALSVEGSYVVMVSRGPDGIERSADDIVQVTTRDSTWLGLGSLEEALRHPIDSPPFTRTAR